MYNKEIGQKNYKKKYKLSNMIFLMTLMTSMTSMIDYIGFMIDKKRNIILNYSYLKIFIPNQFSHLDLSILKKLGLFLLKPILKLFER